ncbi:HAESA-like 1 [Tasmannia lanceolata]|uniref:HAESA-like 1 n=1 Tax=Tasmannia lanceolata TaxID=3420 RepID=UPI004063FF60
MFLHYFLFLFLFLSQVSSLNQEGLYLQRLKLGLDDPNRVLSDWNPRDATPCNWTGVTCDSLSHVTRLDLSSTAITGPFPTLLCRLNTLSFLSLSNNFINSSLPSDISTCQNLTHLDLSQNLLVGTLPPTLSHLPNLLYLDLSGNNFTGAVPSTFAGFRRLESISLVANLFNETLPPFFSNISTLKQLNLSYNPFSPSIIPPEYGNLTNLQTLWLAGCNLVGQIPESLANLNNLIDLDLSQNHLHGPIPPTITLLSNVVQIELYSNSLSGEFPAGMSKLAALRRFDAAMNDLEGHIPDELCGLELESLNLYENRFAGSLPESITKSPNLYELRLFGNRLSGPLPRDLGRNSPLMWVDLSGNQFSGEIPEGLCEKGVLEELLLLDNSLEGEIPASLGQCRSLTRIRLKGNRLSGEVPVGLWGLPHVSLLELAGNSFHGQISPAISGALNLSMLVISDNLFTGVIPSEIGSLEQLVEFSGGNNQLTGSLPASLGSLMRLGSLDLHNNELSGEIPLGIKWCKKLSELNLADNGIWGGIPKEIGYLPVLNYLDLSGNRLTGEIPLELQNLKLNRFNLSNNRFSGKLPPMYANQIYRESFLANPGLCGDIIGLCSSSQEELSRNRGFVWLLRLIFVIAGLVLIVGIGLFYWRYRNYNKEKMGVDKSKWTLTSFHKLGFSEYEILDCLDEDNVIGSGASGKVYKAVLSNGEAVAVKKLWGGSKKGEYEDSDDMRRISDDGFEAEVCTLGKIRHKNIVRLWCCCTARDCKLLVYEYMPNGSLGDLLHSSKGGLLDWRMRYKIAVDAAEGLSYLHHDCAPPIVHRDVKSNNILLDGEFGARVADFGVAKIVEAIGKGPKSMSVIAGSCGYIAPEYAYTLRVNEKSDIYSFGVVILELVTGKRPVDPEFGEKDLVKWVGTTLEQNGVEHILDPKLDICFKGEMCKALNIGLLCTNPLPINRPSMRRVVKMLHEVTAESKLNPTKKDGMLSPYYSEDASDQGSVV